MEIWGQTGRGLARPASVVVTQVDGAVIYLIRVLLFVELPQEASSSPASRVLSFAAQLLSCAAPTHSVLARERSGCCCSSSTASGMSAPSSDDARGVPSGSSVPAYPGYAADDPKISAYLAHLAHVGDEMATGLGALFADQFPEVPSLELIHEGFTFSKNDSLLLFASLEGNALTLAQCQAEGGTAAELIGRVLGHIADLHEGFLRTVMAASSPTSGDVPPTTSSSSVFATPAAHPAQLNLSGGDRRGAGQGAPGISPGALAGPDGSQPVFIQHHDEREGVDEGDGHPGDLPGGLPATALAIQDLRGNSARLKAAYEASLRELQTADTAASATAASAALVPAGLNPAAISVDLSLPLALRSVGRSPSVPAAVRKVPSAQLVRGAIARIVA